MSSDANPNTPLLQEPSAVPSRRTLLRAIAFGAAIVGAFVIGLLIRGAVPSTGTGAEATATASAEAGMWTCSMHPHIMLPGPGQCPICGMDLIPAASGGTDSVAGAREITLSAYARKLADIHVEPVKRRHVEVEVGMVGKVAYDERNVGNITAWVGGRIDKLFVDFTGEKVRKGAPLVLLYSPELLSAQQELLEALRAVKALGGSTYGTVRETTMATVVAARERLRLWGLTPKQIALVESTGKASDHVTIRAPVAGTVIHKNGVEGMYVKTGTAIYRIADLSRLWVLLDAYESDLPWLGKDREVAFHTEAFPGEAFSGRVTFIDPFVDDRTRTAKVRLEVDNRDGRLKPGMFVRATLRARAHDTADGAAGADAADTPPPLVIPVSAPLITGKRAVVYVAVPGTDGAFEGREIVLGPRAGDHYVVISGLEEGENVVVKGAFKIDSSVQILAKPSMMSTDEADVETGHDHTRADLSSTIPAFTGVSKVFQEQLTEVLRAYFAVHGALSTDKADEARVAAGTVIDRLDEVNMKLVKGDAHEAWMRVDASLRSAASAVAASASIEDSRAAFATLSEVMSAGVASFGIVGVDVYRLHCPMALGGKGADWLQPTRATENPYYGASMFSCGSVEETLSGGSEESE